MNVVLEPVAPMSFFPRHLAAESRAGRFLRLCLVLSVWQAPVPWVHAHAAGPAMSLPPAQAQHVRRFHSNFERRDARKLDWHVHFGLLSEFLGDGDEERPIGQPTRSSDATAFQPLEPGGIVPALESLGDVLLDPLIFEGSPRLSPQPPFSRVGYFATYGPSAPLLVLICVARR